MAEHMTPVVAKVLPEEKAAFAAATQLVGTTPFQHDFSISMIND